MIDLVMAHPRSVEVALAVRDALDRMTLHELPPEPTALACLRADRMLEDFRPLVISVAAAQDTSLAVLLIESGAWTRYSLSPEGVDVETHVDGPQQEESVVVTSEVVLRALLDGTLGLARAAKLGLLIVVRPAVLS
jgi:hypothetical protein